ncbi:MAG: helix-turn-helix domain-containing protein [Acutalibacteraceae bacterium]
MSDYGFMAVRHWVIRGKYFETANEKLVYLVLADHTDDRGECFPSLATLCAESLLSKPTVLKALKSLEDKGLIVKRRRKLDNGGASSNVYHVTMDVDNVKRHSESDTLDKTLYQAPESTTTVEPTCEPTPTEPAPHKREEYPTAFEQLWTIYPKHVAKMAAYKAWRKAKLGMNSAFLLAKVQAFAAQCANTETRFIPNFATWLNGERWNDEYRPDPPQSRKPATNAERNMQNLTQAMQSQTDLFGFQIESGVSRP